MKKTLGSILPLLGFLILIYLAYSLLFSNKRLKEASREIQAMDQELGTVSTRLDKAIASLDSAMIRLQESQEQIRLIQAEGDTGHLEYFSLLDSNLARMQKLQQKMQSERREIEQLRKK